MNSRLKAVPSTGHRHEGSCNFCSRAFEGGVEELNNTALTVSQTEARGGHTVVRFCRLCLDELALAIKELPYA